MTTRDDQEWVERIYQLVEEYLQGNKKANIDIDNTINCLNPDSLCEFLKVVPSGAVICFDRRFEELMRFKQSKTILLHIKQLVERLSLEEVKQHGLFEGTIQVNPFMVVPNAANDSNYGAILHSYEEAVTAFLRIGDPKREEALLTLVQKDAPPYQQLVDSLDEWDVFLLARRLPSFIQQCKQKQQEPQALALINALQKRARNLQDPSIKWTVQKQLHYGKTACFFPTTWSILAPILDSIRTYHTKHYNDPARARVWDKIATQLPKQMHQLQMVFELLTIDDLEVVDGCLNEIFRRWKNVRVRKFITRMKQHYSYPILIDYWDYGN